MWSKRLLGSVGVGASPDTYAVGLGFKTPSTSTGIPQFSRHTTVGENGELFAGVGVTWTDEDELQNVIVRLAGAAASPVCRVDFPVINSRRWTYIRHAAKQVWAQISPGFAQR